MDERRKSTRFESSAIVKIAEIGNEQFFLKDISVTGCRIKCPSGSVIAPNKQFTLQIMPEREANIDSFTISSEPKWIHVDRNACEIGFPIIESPKGKQFQYYLDYLSWRSSHGKSITGTA